jgi:hypothetical protein
MAALSALFPNIVDLAKKTDPNGGMAEMVELLAKKNAFLQDLAFKQGNLPTGHRFSARVALPSPTWRKLNQGIAASKGTQDTIEESCGMLEGLSKVDVALAELNGNAAGFRKDEDDAFVAAFGLEVARALFKESTGANPERIQGMEARFTKTGVHSAQMVDAAGASGQTDCSSIWLVGWSPSTVYGIYPKNGVTGLQSKDLGEQLVKDSGGVNEFRAYVTHHKWALGLAVQDYRYVSRIHSVDTSALTADASSGANIPVLLQDAIATIYDMESVQPVIYMNRKLFAFFNKQLFNKTVNLLEYVERGGRLVPHFLGIPVRIADALTNDESSLN